MTGAARAAPRDGALHDVAIVGFGPVGATLACLLAQRGLSVLVLERDAEIYRLPRAIHYDGEVMRVFQSIGLADALLPGLETSPGMRFVDAEGHVLIDWRRPPGIGPQGWHAGYKFHQPTLERMLRERLAAIGGADVRLRHETFALDEAGVGVGRDRSAGDGVDFNDGKDGGDGDDRAVRLRFEDLSSGRLHEARARWVVGCDGARSTVRRFMGTELEDLRSHERWLVVDVILVRERPDLGDHSIQYCDPARPATYVRGVGMRRRWELMLLPGEDPAEMTRPETLWRLLSRWVTPEDAVLERPACYTFHSVVARGWRRGRLLIAGDAAHQTPPFLGQGMCAGIRDAANLAWKLAEVVRGRAPESLLDTYERERAPHVREFIEAAVRLGGVIQTTDPEAARRRDAEMRARPLAFTTPAPRLGPGAHAGGDGPAGRIGEQPVLGDGRRLDDVVGDRHALLVDAGLADAARAAAGDRAVVVVADSDASRDWLARLGVRAVWLRPDRYVAGVAGNAREVAALAGSAQAGEPVLRQ
jgi:3-(3-hydroxy-phenyl)propionate hydroxylase